MIEDGFAGMFDEQFWNFSKLFSFQNHEFQTCELVLSDLKSWSIKRLIVFDLFPQTVLP